MSKKKKRIVKFEAGEPELENWLTDFTGYLNATPEKGKADLPTFFAEGFAKVHSVEKGFTFRMVDYTLNSDFIYKSRAASKFFLILYFYHFSDLQHLFFQADDEVVVDTQEKNYSSLLMTNSLVTQELQVTAGTRVQGLTIQLTDEWLREKISRPETAGYELLMHKKVFQALIYPKAQKLLHELFDPARLKMVPALFYVNRVSLLLEGFLEKILRHEDNMDALPPSKRDIESLLRIESYLIENFAAGFPGVEFLSRMALMSPTKLKIIFKRAFGKSMFEYFQKNRMHKAREYLGSGNYSVAEVALRLGYQNLSNFSIAFKKEFGILPRTYITQG